MLWVVNFVSTLISYGQKDLHIHIEIIDCVINIFIPRFTTIYHYIELSETKKKNLKKKVSLLYYVYSILASFVS